MAKDDDAKRRNSKELFLRVDVDFILNDPRCVLLTAEQFRVYLQISALALQARRELLPTRYDLRATALLLRTTAVQLHATVKQLCEMQDPLLSIDRGRIRVNGLKARYDGRFRWKGSDNDAGYDELSDEEVGTWVVDDNCSAVAYNRNAVACNCIATAPEEEEEEEEDVEEENRKSEIEAPPHCPPEGGTATAKATATEALAFASPDNGNGKKAMCGKVRDKIHPYALDLIDKWVREEPEKFNSIKKLYELLAKRTWAIEGLALVIDIELSDTAGSKLAVLYQEMTKARSRWPVRDAALNLAKSRLNDKQDAERLFGNHLMPAALKKAGG